MYPGSASGAILEGVMRIQRFAAIGAIAAVALLSSCTGDTPSPSPLNISFNDIAKVQAYIVPEGSNPPPLVNDPQAAASPGNLARSLSIVRDVIPSPFPAPQQCNYSGEGDGLKLTVWLKNGQHLDYFACAFPSELDSLYSKAFLPVTGGGVT